MDFNWSAEEEAFREEVQTFLRQALPAGWGEIQFWDPDDDNQFTFAHTFTKKLGAKNWLAVSWPKEYGGLDWPFWKPLAEDPLVRQRLAQLATEVEVARSLAWRIASVQTHGDIPGPEAPALKVFSSELFQRIAQVGMQLLGLYGQLDPGSKWAPLMGAVERLYLVSVSRTIAAGTSEIQRNILAERGLGLPR